MPGGHFNVHADFFNMRLKGFEFIEYLLIVDRNMKAGKNTVANMPEKLAKHPRSGCGESVCMKCPQKMGYCACSI